MKQPTIKPNYQSTHHRDGTVSFWNVYARQWERKSAAHIPDTVLSTLPQSDRDRIKRMA